MSNQPKYIVRWFNAKDSTYKVDHCNTFNHAETIAKALISMGNVPMENIAIYRLVATPAIVIHKEPTQ